MLFPVGKQSFTITGSRTVASTDGWNSRQFTNTRHKGVRIVVDRTAETGTATLNVKVQYKNKVNGNWIDLEGSSMTEWADGAVDERSMIIYPGITAADADAQIALDTDEDHLVGQYLPKYWRVAVTTTGTTNVFSIYGEYLP